MCTLVSKTFRAAQRDIEVIYRDALGVEKRLYIGLVSPAGPVDVDAKIAAHFAEEDQLAENVRLALNPQPVRSEAPVVEPQRPPAVAEAAKPPEPMPPKIEVPAATKRKKGKK